MKTITFILTLFLFSCQPDYGHLQPEYEMFLHYMQEKEFETNVVKKNTHRIDSLNRELQEMKRMIDEYERMNKN
jgi:hypothetical protein